VDYQYDDRSNVYLTYARDTGRTDETSLGAAARWWVA
jgi:hypothetical protein